MKTTIHHDQGGFIPETQSRFNMWKEVRATHHNNSIKDKRHTVIAIDTEKHLILLKTLNKLRSEGNFFNIIKAFTKNIGLASYLMIKAWKLSLEDQNKTRMSAPTTSIHGNGLSSQESRAAKGSNRHPAWKWKIKLPRSTKTCSCI